VGVLPEDDLAEVGSGLEVVVTVGERLIVGMTCWALFSTALLVVLNVTLTRWRGKEDETDEG
jgi:hypothetical protein